MAAQAPHLIRLARLTAALGLDPNRPVAEIAIVQGPSGGTEAVVYESDGYTLIESRRTPIRTREENDAIGEALMGR